MKILVDTSIWSLALRRDLKQNKDIKKELAEIIKEVRIQMIGSIRQEILSGIKSKKQFQELKFYLSAFPDLAIETKDFVQAAEFFNLCRSEGVQGSNTDFLICAVAVRNRFSIYTTDKDFDLFSKHIQIVLHQTDQFQPK